MAYTIEDRIKALEHSKNGLTDTEVSTKTGISKHTIAGWKKLLLTTGSLEKKKVKRKSGKPYKYKPEKIGALLDKRKESGTTASKDDKVQAIPKVKATTKEDAGKAKKDKSKLKLQLKL